MEAHNVLHCRQRRAELWPTHTHTRLTSLFLGLPRWAGTRKEKPIWILLKQETVCGSGISWAVCKSAPCSRQTTTPALHHSVFYRPDDLPAAQPTASKDWRQIWYRKFSKVCICGFWDIRVGKKDKHADYNTLDSCKGWSTTIITIVLVFSLILWHY